MKRIIGFCILVFALLSLFGRFTREGARQEAEYRTRSAPHMKIAGPLFDVVLFLVAFHLMRKPPED